MPPATELRSSSLPHTPRLPSVLRLCRGLLADSAQLALPPEGKMLWDTHGPGLPLKGKAEPR